MNNKVRGCFGERPLPEFVVDPQALHRRTRRDVLLFGAGAMAALAGGGSLLPQDTLTRLGLRRNMNSGGKEWLLNRALRIDDDVAETLYSSCRTVPTYTRSQITPLKNNYNGAAPDPGYIPGWHLTLDGLASGVSVALLVPVKLGVKNVKAVTKLTYVAQEPRDYWAERGYSHYDGI